MLRAMLSSPLTARQILLLHTLAATSCCLALAGAIEVWAWLLPSGGPHQLTTGALTLIAASGALVLSHALLDDRP